MVKVSKKEIGFVVICLSVAKCIKTGCVNRVVKINLNSLIMQRLKLYLRNEDKNGYMTIHRSDPNAEIERLQDKIIELQFKLKNQQNKLRSVSEFNKELNANLIHNLKNPLGSVYSFAEMILESHQKYSPEKLASQLKVLQQSAEYSISLMNGYADYLSSLTVTTTQTQEPFDFNLLMLDVIEAVNDNNRMVYDKKKLSTPLMVFANRSDVRVVFEELLDNALRFSSIDTEVCIKTDELDEKIKLNIKDEGIGIENGNLKSVCHPFFTAATYDCHKEKCTGLGLAVAKNLINRNGGELEFESVLNHGTTAIIHLNKM
jgi:signal transduction histidine kinase